MISEDLVACAIAALALGSDSAPLVGLAMLREHDQGAILTGILGTCTERNRELALSEEAFERSYDSILSLMMEGRLAPRGSVGQAVDHGGQGSARDVRRAAAGVQEPVNGLPSVSYVVIASTDRPDA